MAVVTNFIAGRANRALKKVTGNFLGNTFGRTTTSPVAALNREKGSMSGIKGSEDFLHLAFPLDVMSDTSTGNHGHYIMFYVNQQKKAKIRFHDRGTGSANLKRQMGDAGYSVGIKNSKTYDSLKGGWVDTGFGGKIHQQAIEGASDEKVSNDIETKGSVQMANLMRARKTGNINTYAQTQSFFVERLATTKSKMAITMYMPATVTSTYGATYTDTQIGPMTDQALNAFNSLMEGDWGKFGHQVGNMDTTFKEQLSLMAQTFLGGIPSLGGLKEASSMKEGRIYADKMELAFKGVPKRQFQYTFKMMPKSQRESDEVHEIIKAFKQNMLPEFMGIANSRKMIVPNTFDIQYMYVNSKNQYLHTIGESVLENMTVTYGGDRYKTFTGIYGRGAPPVETTMTLSFKEFDILTRERVVDDNA